jgi:hypothetical protein
VADFVHRRKTLGVMARGRLARFPTEALADFGPTLGVDINLDVGASGPDICAVRLAPEWAGFLEARGCTFYSIDTRMNDPEVIHGDDGIYFVTGAPSALLDRPKWQIGTLSYSTDICRRWDADGWDYVLANLNIEESGELPRDLGGVSGGGLWRVRYEVDATRTQFRLRDPSKSVILVGVNFHQTGEPGRQLVTHGPRSVYELLPAHLP